MKTRSLNKYGLPWACTLLALGLLLMEVGCVEKSKEIPPEVPKGGVGMQSGPPPGSDPMGAAMAGDPGMTTHAIMEKIGEGPNALTGKIAAGLGADPVPWDELKTQAKEYVDLTTGLGRSKPPRGSPESWPKFVGEFTGAATAVAEAIDKQDKAAALEAHTKLTAQCAACHKEHKPVPAEKPAEAPAK